MIYLFENDDGTITSVKIPLYPGNGAFMTGDAEKAGGWESYTDPETLATVKDKLVSFYFDPKHKCVFFKYHDIANPLAEKIDAKKNIWGKGSDKHHFYLAFGKTADELKQNLQQMADKLRGKGKLVQEFNRITSHEV